MDRAKKQLCLADHQISPPPPLLQAWHGPQKQSIAEKAESSAACLHNVGCLRANDGCPSGCKWDQMQSKRNLKDEGLQHLCMHAQRKKWLITQKMCKRVNKRPPKKTEKRACIKEGEMKRAFMHAMMCWSASQMYRRDRQRQRGARTRRGWGEHSSSTALSNNE